MPKEKANPLGIDPEKMSVQELVEKHMFPMADSSGDREWFRNGHQIIENAQYLDFCMMRVAKDYNELEDIKS